MSATSSTRRPASTWRPNRHNPSEPAAQAAGFLRRVAAGKLSQIVLDGRRVKHVWSGIVQILFFSGRQGRQPNCLRSCLSEGEQNTCGRASCRSWVFQVGRADSQAAPDHACRKASKTRVVGHCAHRGKIEGPAANIHVISRPSGRGNGVVVFGRSFCSAPGDRIHPPGAISFFWLRRSHLPPSFSRFLSRNHFKFPT